MESIHSSYYLPHRFKRIGWVLLAFSVLSYVGLLLVVELLELVAITGPVIAIGTLIPVLFTLSLALLISSREKKEDEMIRLIRLKSFQYGLYLSVGIFLFLFVYRRIGFLLPSLPGAIDGILIYPVYMFARLDTITATLLYIAVIYQYKLWRLRTDEE